MIRIRDFIISLEAPADNKAGWIIPLEDGTFRLKIFGPNGWTDISSVIEIL